jgi:predicted TIM-barrel fold metal-dependent hydrolase
MMHKFNIKKSILSISSPGTYFLNKYDKLARKTARECKRYAHDLKRTHPDKFEYWAVLPLPDVEGSLMEIDYALKHLNADGICLEANAHGHYNGDEKFDLIFESQKRHKVTVFIHPTAPCMYSCDTRLDTITAAPLPEDPFPIFEFMFDTARSLMNLCLSGTVEKYPDIKYIIPHAGGAFPPLVQQFANIPQMIGRPKFVGEAFVRKALRDQFWWNLAAFVNQ